ncbi:hypothetical protein CAPTEDRAFT_201233 [Capitella teleta]|uniref:Uncharacterized protein n=1 Tax=Capitella teleta TaxID=283909 RepID=R7V1R0_CAPTE|nr:hypothetical protein CAPTEDRAFT_201233 [Capitella teleta]|eukprot:ELU10256.1 hypothetical protein CAPTEDRAFT_201233 [Capitella teleta]
MQNLRQDENRENAVSERTTFLHRLYHSPQMTYITDNEMGFGSDSATARMSSLLESLPAKKRKLMTPEAGTEASDDVLPMEELPPLPPPLPPPPLDMSKNFKEHDRLAQALTDLTALRSQYQAQSQKLNRLQERLEEKLEVELELQKERERVKNLRRLHLQLF